MKMLFYIRILIFLSFTLMQIDPVFAAESKPSPLSLDEFVDIIDHRYQREKTISDFILQMNFEAPTKNFLLKTALKNGVYDKDLPKMKLVKKDGRLIFTFEKSISFELVKSNGSFWVNNQLVEMKKVKDVNSVYDEIIKILSKRNSQNVFIESFFSKAQAQSTSDAPSDTKMALVISTVGEAWRSLCKKVVSTDFCYMFSKQDFLIQELGVIDFKCDKSMPTEVSTKKHGLFKIFYDGKGHLNKIEDSKNCKHIVKANGYFEPVIIENRTDWNDAELAKKCIFPDDGFAGAYNSAEDGIYPVDWVRLGAGHKVKKFEDRVAFDKTAKKYADVLFGYQFLINECEKDPNLKSFKEKSQKFQMTQNTNSKTKSQKEELRRELRKELQQKAPATGKGIEIVH